MSREPHQRPSDRRPGTGSVAEVILCDPLETALLSHIPRCAADNAHGSRSEPPRVLLAHLPRSGL